MNSTQLSRYLHRANRTIRGAALEMGIHERTLYRYLAGETPIPKLVELVVRRWVNHPKPNR